ncbi:MAG: branched-chain amino acid transporter [Zetaproteobacteria bacterium]|nr:branched-chain amino acid transporter [Pseudobdellovibrionaceae bacterium]
MHAIKKVVPIGLAMFSMYFGSGNIVFPMLVGQKTGVQSTYAIFGLLITAVLVPFLALVAMFFYNGSYFLFFKRLGTKTAWILITIIMALIGPLAIIPRCVLISFSTIQTFFPTTQLILFNATSCLLIFACTYKRSRIIDILGVYLTPVLLLCLVIIIAKGFLSEAVPVNVNDLTSLSAFKFGLIEGYNTMDIFGSFMFSGVILSSIKSKFTLKSEKDFISISFLAGIIGMGALALVYMGICFVSSRYVDILSGVPTERLLSVLTLHLLGPYAGIIVCIAVSLACLTTAISLALVFSEFVSNEVLAGKVPYQKTLCVTLLISFLISTMEFSGIQKFLVPILVVCLPCFILLSVLNLAHKTIGFNMVKLPVLLLFVYSFYTYVY